MSCISELKSPSSSAGFVRLSERTCKPLYTKKEEDRNQTQRRDHSEKTALSMVILHPSHFSRKRCPKSLSAKETFPPFVFLCTGSPPAVINKTFPAQPSHLLFFWFDGLLFFPSFSPLVFKCQSCFVTSYLSFPFASLFIVSRY